MTHKELTVADVLNDPLIRQLMKADRISHAGMAALLQEAARKLKAAGELRNAPEVNIGSNAAMVAGFRPVAMRRACYDMAAVRDDGLRYQACGR
ncbi:MAG: hypothetical protein QM636_04005 [Rhizobium sp.]